MQPEFDADKAAGKFPQGQIPVLTVTKDGKVTEIAQSRAIERYLASSFGLMGSSSEEGAVIDSVCELIAEIRTKFNADKGDADKKAAFYADFLPSKFALIENYMATASAGDFIVGGKVG